ncbi:MAG: hypothetical protein ACRDXX_18660, partial [Stackebrandtia sp.]
MGFAATAAFLAIVVHSPESTTARNLALTALGAAWFIAPLSGIPAFGLLTFPELILAWAAAATFIPPRRQMSAGEMFGWSPVWYVVFIGVGALVGGMLIGGGVTQANLLHVARLFASSLTALVILRRFDPTPRELRWLAAAWVGGAMTSAVWAFTGGVAPSGRLEGFTSHPNQLAMISTMALPVIIILTSSDRFGLLRDTPVIRRAITVGGVTTLLAASIMSGSRSGLLALAAVLAL